MIQLENPTSFLLLIKMYNDLFTTTARIFTQYFNIDIIIIITKWKVSSDLLFWIGLKVQILTFVLVRQACKRDLILNWVTFILLLKQTESCEFSLREKRKSYWHAHTLVMSRSVSIKCTGMVCAIHSNVRHLKFEFEHKKLWHTYFFTHVHEKHKNQTDCQIMPVII